MSRLTLKAAGLFVALALLAGCRDTGPPAGTPAPPGTTLAAPTATAASGEPAMLAATAAPDYAAKPEAPTPSAAEASPSPPPSETPVVPPPTSGLTVAAPQRLAGHRLAAGSLAFSSDGTLLASTGQDEEVRLWDVASGELVQVFEGGSHSVKALDWSPDGRQLATLDGDQTITLRDSGTGEAQRQIGDPVHLPCGLEFSPDGLLLATGHVDQVVRLWDVATGDLVRTLTGMRGLTCPVAFSPDGSLLASGGGTTDSRVLVWEVATGDLVHQLAGHLPNVYRVVFAPGGRRLASASGDRTAKIWDVASGQLLHDLEADRYKLMTVAFSPDGRVLATGGDDGQVRLWDVERGELLETLRGHTQEVYAVAFSPVDWVLASAGEGGEVLLWRITPAGAQPPRSGGPDDLIAYYSDRDGNPEIYVSEASEAEPRRLTFDPSEDSSPAWSPDGSQIAFISDRDDANAGQCFPDCLYQLYMFPMAGGVLEAGVERRLVETEFRAMHPDWSPDGTLISFDTEFNLEGDVYVVNAGGAGLRLLIKDGFWADWSPDGSQIVFASNRDGNVELYVADVDATAMPAGDVRRLTDNHTLEYFPAWSPDGRWVAYARLETKQIYALDLESGDEVQLTHLRNAENPAWSSDGRLLAFQSSHDGDFEIYVVDVEAVLQGGEGAEPRPLTDNDAADLWPSWGPSPGP